MFVLDANIFVEAHKRYYSFDIVPGFWRELEQKAEDNLLISIDRVLIEISNGDQADNLNVWANSSFKPYFVSTDNELIINSYKDVINWAVSQAQYTQAAKDEFASVADSWLVAYAKANNYTVVTHEQYSPEAQRRILIPNACRAMNVPYVNTFEMLRNLNIRLG